MPFDVRRLPVAAILPWFKWLCGTLRHRLRLDPS